MRHLCVSSSPGHRGFSLVELMISVAIIGILAAIAIPSFVSYIRRTKTSEAVVNLRRIFDGAAAYFPDEWADRAGNPLPKQFPASQGLTPNPIPSGTTTYTPDADWRTPTWEALGFHISDPHYYSYEFQASGFGTAAACTIRAMGDLDGDGVPSMFERIGSVTPGMVVAGSKGVYESWALE